MMPTVFWVKMIETWYNMIFLGSGTPLMLILALCDATAFSMVQLHSLCQDDQNEVQHDFFGHLT